MSKAASLIRDCDDQSYSQLHGTYFYFEKERVNGLLVGGFFPLEKKEKEKKRCIIKQIEK